MAIIYVDVWSQACEMFRLVRECDREVQLWQTESNMTLVLISNLAGEAGKQTDPITSFIGPQRAPFRTEGLLGGSHSHLAIRCPNQNPHNLPLTSSNGDRVEEFAWLRESNDTLIHKSIYIFCLGAINRLLIIIYQ